MVSFGIRFLSIHSGSAATAVIAKNDLQGVLADPSVSYWLNDALRAAYERDPVDALRDARWLLKLLGERYTQIVNRDLAIIGTSVTHLPPGAESRT